MASGRDYYEVLGIERTASQAEVKSAFRRLARELHPDVNSHDPEAEAKFKQAAEAYEVLSDPGRRRTYDQFGQEGLRSGGFDPRTADFGSFQDIFETIFGGDPFGGRRGPAAGADVGTVAEIELIDVLDGTEKEVRFEAISVCEHCRGNGAEPGTPIEACDRCDGTGQLRQVSRSVFGQVVRAVPCDRCGGGGRIPSKPCKQCNGAGRVSEMRTWEVDIPAGIEDGQRIRIAGAGHEGDPGARAGDLFVEVHVAADERFARQGTEIVSRVPLPVTTAILGGTVTVPTLEGETSVDVPVGTQHGDASVLKGLGLPPLQGRRKRGDQHVVFDVVVPANLTDEQRELVRRLDAELFEGAATREAAE
ncbi:MAG TPA: molecular chaperone DnaJ [Solirubrobacterales bacterium]|nr:molecular chaperone DnaJ [Solirubrobacterales bacterium]